MRNEYNKLLSNMTDQTQWILVTRITEHSIYKVIKQIIESKPLL